MTPTVRMPDPERAYRLAALSELCDALCVARCSAELAGGEAESFVVRELLITVLQEIDRASAIIRRLSVPGPPAHPSR